MGYFAIKTTGEVGETLQVFRDRLEHKDALDGLAALPRLFVTGTIRPLALGTTEGVYGVQVTYLFPQYHWYVVIASFLLWLLFSWTFLLVVSICFVLPSILWVSYLQYWLLKKGVQKAVPSATVTWLGSGRLVREALA